MGIESPPLLWATYTGWDSLVIHIFIKSCEISVHNCKNYKVFFPNFEELGLHDHFIHSVELTVQTMDL